MWMLDVVYGSMREDDEVTMTRFHLVFGILWCRSHLKAQNCYQQGTGAEGERGMGIGKIMGPISRARPDGRHESPLRGSDALIHR